MTTELINNEETKVPVQDKSLTEETTQPGFSNSASWHLVKAQAATLSNSSIIPKAFQKNPSNCLVALNMSNRLGADPLMVMQNLYIVNGNPSWSSQFLISTFNTCGRFTAIRYRFVGEEGNDNYGCCAYAIEKATGEVLQGAIVTIDIAKKEGWYSKNGSKWQTMPQQMLMYRAASWFVRAYAPEISMGLQTQDELIDTIDITENTQDNDCQMTASDALKQVLGDDVEAALFDE